MNLPRNVLRFEVLLYLSLTLDALSVAFQDRTPNAELSERAILMGTVVAGCMITLLVFMVWLAAQRRKKWPRRVISAALALSVISLGQVIGQGGLGFETNLEGGFCAPTAGGFGFFFTRGAKGGVQ